MCRSIVPSLPYRRRLRSNKPRGSCAVGTTSIMNGIGTCEMTIRRSRRQSAARFSLCSLLFALSFCVALYGQQNIKFDAATVSGLPSRNIGSATMSGRIAAVDAVTQDGRLTLFVGSASGGVWKSVNGGTTFKAVFDRQDVQSIGAVTIDPSNPKNVWAGTGEGWTRNSVSVGDGIYKSTDGGE